MQWGLSGYKIGYSDFLLDGLKQSFLVEKNQSFDLAGFCGCFGVNPTGFMFFHPFL